MGDRPADDPRKECMIMKNKYFYRAMIALLAGCLMVPITGDASRRDDDDRGRDTRNEHQEMLEDLLDMSSERLARTRSVIEQLEAMDSDEREELRKRVRHFHRQSEEEIKRLRDRWRKMSHEERREFRRELRERWEGLWPDEEGDEGEDAEGRVDPGLEQRFFEYFAGLPFEERRRIMRELRSDGPEGGQGERRQPEDEEESPEE